MEAYVLTHMSKGIAVVRKQQKEVMRKDVRGFVEFWFVFFFWLLVLRTFQLGAVVYPCVVG